ncbi:MAG: hypothetical protein KF773_20185 [Deltaproteobacteria bacterium]|nr:hypothetical protein [Deltaproteobacteria bacterium]
MMRKHGLVLLLGCAAFTACGDNIRPEFNVETSVPKTTVAAGETIGARCAILDADGEPALDVRGDPLTDSVAFTITYQVPGSFAKNGEDQVIAARAGEATVRCAAPELDLVDPDPVTLQIVAGPGVRAITQLEKPAVLAGEPDGVTCLVFDAFDNPVTDFTHTLAIAPFGAGTTVESASVSASLVGEYDVSCVVMNAAEVAQARMLVTPALPASIVASLDPERSVYRIDEQVTMVAEARDRFGNRVDEVTFAYTTAPTIPSPSEARFRFSTDGTYQLTATVTSPTQNNVPLRATLSVAVDTAGPAIECMRIDAPATASEAYMLQAAPGVASVPVRVSDTFAIQSVRINGGAATFNAGTGAFHRNVTLDFGMNFVDVVATDMFGRENSTTCTVLAAATYTPEANHVTGALGLRLDPASISDAVPGGLNSLNDILIQVLRSTQLRTLVDGGLLGSNPISNGSCGVFACQPRVNYNGGSVNWNTPSSTLSLIPGGLRAQVTLPNVRLQVNACGTTCCIGGSNITVTSNVISATVDFSLQLQGGVLRAAVQGSPNVVVGSVNLDGSGFCGFIIDLVQGFFTGTVRNAVRDALASFINSDVGPLLDQVVSSLDVTTLGTSFIVPRLDTGNVSLGFGLQFSSFEVTTQRALLGIGTRFTPGAVAHNRPSLGIARRQATALLDPPGTTTPQPVGLSAYEGVLNQVLHGLWRAGYFQANLSFGGSGTATIDARLPPVAAFQSGNRALLHLGGVAATITVPGFINAPIPIVFGGRANASVSLVGNDLRFGNLALTNLFVSFNAPLTQQQRDAMANLLTQVLQEVLADALGDGLPAFPIPSFALPASVAQFGLPAGAELGIVSPQLSTTGSHAVLVGGFGVRN